MLGRLAGFFLILGAVAVLAPRFAPALLTGLANTSAPADEPVRNPAPGYSRQAALRADPLGHFITNAVVNGHSLEMIVDTGASVVALTGDTARRLGIYPSTDAFRLTMSTANGPVAAAPVTLNEIRIGSVVIRDVPAVVFSGNGLGVNLLGMTFLKRLTRFEIGGGQLVLVQ